MTTRHLLLPVSLAVLSAACHEPVEPMPAPSASMQEASLSEGDDAANVVTIDHAVPHVSTVPANAGELVQLAVRERVRGGIAGPRGRKAVLMIHGLSVPVLPGMELRYPNYDWALWLARSGDFDVFMLDFQGSGRSPRPRMDDPCNAPPVQQALVPQNPACLPSYPFQLTTARSDWDEINTVVDYIRASRGVEKVALVAWSHGAARVGPFAVQHPEKVESLLLYAPFYNPAAPAGRAGTGADGFGPPINPATGLPFVLPQPGTPMTLTTRSTVMGDWNREIGCTGQVEDGVQNVVWSAIMANDPIGSTWASPTGVMRVRTFFLWGWNAATVARITVPTLIVHGEFDQRVPATQSLLYDHLTGVPNDNRLLFEVACAGHHLVWEEQRTVLHQISKQWLKHLAVEGHSTGKFHVDADGVVHPR